MYPAGNANPARLRQRLQTCRYVYSVTPKVVAIKNELPEVDAHTKLDSLVLWHVSVARGHAALYLNGTPHGVHDACEFHKCAVPDDPHYPPVKFLDVGLDEPVPMGLPLGERAFVVIFDEATVPGNVGCKNGREPARLAFGHSSPRFNEASLPRQQATTSAAGQCGRTHSLRS